jgi:HEAT repeat protein
MTETSRACSNPGSGRGRCGRSTWSVCVAATGLLVAAFGLTSAGCSSSSSTSSSPSSASSPAASVASDPSPKFAIGASEWSRGGRRRDVETPPPEAPAPAAPTAAVAAAAEPDGPETDERAAPDREGATGSETTSLAAEPDVTAVEREEILATSAPAPTEDRSSSIGTATTAGGAGAVATTRRDGPQAPSPSADREPAPAVAVAAVVGGDASAADSNSPEPTSPDPTRTSSSASASVAERPKAVEPTSTPPSIGTRETARSSTAPSGPERPLSNDPIEAATAILAAGVRSADPVVRANALEGMLAWPSLLREHVAGGLVDDNRGVRFVAAMCVGRARLDDLSHLVQPLVRDRSDSVRAAAIYALRRCGRPADPSPLAAMVRSDDPEVRSNAYIVLGELGDSSSIGMIRDSLGRGMRRVHPIRVRIVELQGAETLVKLGDDDELEAIRAALFAPVEQGELSILACQILARLGDRSAAPMLERLVLASGTSIRPPEIRMAATQALAELGLATQVDAAAIAANAVQAPDPLLRAQGCAVAGAVGGGTSVEALRSRLSDPVEFVRITAAGNLLKVAGESSSVADATGVR